MPAKSSAALQRQTSRATSSTSTSRSDTPWLAANPWLDNMPWMAAAAEYAVDAWQRSVLFADVMRQRGNQYQEHLAESAPNVLDFPSEVILDGHDLPRPCNYCLMRIQPPDDAPTLPNARPFVVVDPRAGHGPGIGGFKPDSEIGAALRAGHPCYFVGFLPDPVPGQTVEDVMHAEAAFLEKVISMHPEGAGKPAVIGNCQAGWQVLMTAAMRPELFGPIIVAGAPLSYWAGWRGRNPMRYSGGLLGGSWLTALTSDLGDGRFDGAWLVQNFENLDPANTLWRKKYHLYANVDTEAPRYLGFEKYWGGHVFLNAVEMQYIVDNLFVGNRLTSAELITSDGIRLDLRNIRSPIVVFCSYGDNITPPPQALGFITDMYRDDAEVFSHDQTIVYATHDSIGHLGIFVSSSTGRKEHRKFVNNIDLIDVLPAGIYQAQIAEKNRRYAASGADRWRLCDVDPAAQHRGRARHRAAGHRERPALCGGGASVGYQSRPVPEPRATVGAGDGYAELGVLDAHAASVARELRNVVGSQSVCRTVCRESRAHSRDPAAGVAGQPVPRVSDRHVDGHRAVAQLLSRYPR